MLTVSSGNCEEEQEQEEEEEEDDEDDEDDGDDYGDDALDEDVDDEGEHADVDDDDDEEDKVSLESLSFPLPSTELEPVEALACEGAETGPGAYLGGVLSSVLVLEPMFRLRAGSVLERRKRLQDIMKRCKAETEVNNGGLQILADSTGLAILLFIALFIAT
ncbi:hypothetical protein AK812_SmicGene24664 [Symbiodinium microadriaticum]|uniref:Uncharacterized protein n=1 Tax=Symbiodinium microadriaticum TaxID=2951 RepID=A0A1Q9DEF4_SYMMI|nr:hypothetical protein AK812_SmicGene24664 [Symbiodinium microadriaticum]